MVAGSLGDAVAQARVKARLGHGGGSTVSCRLPDGGAGVPASEQECNHVRHAHNGPGVHEEQE